MAKLRVKPPSEWAEKWARVTPARQQDFQKGVSDPNVKWAEPTVAAKAAYDQGIQESIARGAREAGVAAAGDAKWRRKIQETGVARWAPGVRAARADYQTGVAAPASVLSTVEVNERGPVGSQQNYEKVQQIGEALRADKLRRKGGGV